VLHSQTTAPVSPIAAEYVGSESCKDCHSSVYDRWKKTRMANVVRDPKQHPEAIIPDLTKPDPLVTFTKDDIAFRYGSKWKQALFQTERRRLLSVAGAMGCDAQALAAIFCKGRNGLVDRVLSG